MPDKRMFAVPAMLAALTVVAVLLRSYLAGYFWLTVPDDPRIIYDGPFIVERVYANRTLAGLYRPVGKLDSWLRGVPVLIYAEGDLTFDPGRSS